MTGTPISDDEFSRLVGSVKHERVHFECQRSYDIGEEEGDLEAWVDATRRHRQPRIPLEIGWWRAYLDRARALSDQGVKLIRIRVVDQPPTDYQRWGAWAAPWYAAAGEQIYYLSRGKAMLDGLPANAPSDWDLLDDEQVIDTGFTFGGKVAGSTLITDPATVARYRAWRDIAVAHGTAATRAAA